MSGARLLSRDMATIAAGPQTFTYLPPRLFHQQPYPPTEMGEVEEGAESCPHHYLVEGMARIRRHRLARHLG